MNFRWPRILLLLLALTIGGSALMSAQQAGAPLSEHEITYLLEKKVSSDALAEMVQSYGVAFQTDEGVFQRLKKAGASDALLEAIRAQAKKRELQIEVIKPEPPPPDPVPAPAREHLRLSQEKLKAHDYEGALQEIAEAERIFPQWNLISRQRGLTLAAVGRYAEAISEWKLYLSLASPTDSKGAISRKIAEWEGEASKADQIRVLLTKGDEQLQGGDAESAIQTFRNAVAVGNSIGALLALARAQLMTGDAAGLAKTAREARQLDPQSALASLYLADAEQRQGSSGSSALRDGLASNPALAYGQSVLAREFRQKESHTGSAATPSAAIDRASAESQNHRGWALWNGGFFRQALGEFQEAAELNPTDSGLRCDLAYARLARGDSTGALAAAREAVQLDTQSVCGHHALALSLDRTGQREQAVQEFREAEKLESALGMEGLLHASMNTDGLSQD